MTAGDSADARDGNDTGIDRVGTDIGAEVVEVEAENMDEYDDEGPSGEGGSTLISSSSCCCWCCTRFSAHAR